MKDKNLFSSGNRFFDSICHIPDIPTKKVQKRPPKRSFYTNLVKEATAVMCAEQSAYGFTALFCTAK